MTEREELAVQSEQALNEFMTLGEADYLAILAMSHFYYHLRLSRWGKWNGAPAQAEGLNFATSNAEDYHTYMKKVSYS